MWWELKLFTPLNTYWPNTIVLISSLYTDIAQHVSIFRLFSIIQNQRKLHLFRRLRRLEKRGQLTKQVYIFTKSFQVYQPLNPKVDFSLTINNVSKQLRYLPEICNLNFLKLQTIIWLYFSFFLIISGVILSRNYRPHIISWRFCV